MPQAPNDAAPAAVPDLKGKLAALKGQDQENQAKVDSISKQNAMVRQNIATLEAGIAETDQIIKTYTTQNPGLAADKSSLQAFVDKQMKMAIAAVGAGQAALDAIVTDVDAGIEKQANVTTNLQTSSNEANAAQTAAVTTANEKQTAYETAKTTLGRAQAAISDLKTLETQVTSNAAAGNFGAMYVLLGEMKKVLSSVALPTPDDLEAQLNTSLSELHTALSDARDKKQASEAAAADLATAQKKLNEIKAGRRPSLLNAAKNWKAPTPKPPDPKA